MNIKVVLASLLVISVLAKTSAQEIKWGVKGGFNWTSFQSDLSGVSSTPGFHFGGIAEIRASEKWFVQPELFYSLEGAKVSGSFQDEDMSLAVTNNLKLGYIQMPVMLKHVIVDGFSLEIGPQIGYLVTAKNRFNYTMKMNEMEFGESGTDDVKEDFKKISLVLNAGAGYEFKNKIFMQARYFYGNANISKNSEDNEGVSGDISNKGFQFSVGFKF
jgi:opacity protein-like surface antigen